MKSKSIKENAVPGYNGQCDNIPALIEAENLLSSSETICYEGGICSMDKYIVHLLDVVHRYRFNASVVTTGLTDRNGNKVKSF